MKEKVSRRSFLTSTMAVGTASAVSGFSTARPVPVSPGSGTEASVTGKVCVFSKHLQWLDYQGMAAFAREAGFDGIDLTVRPGGHVEPEQVEKDLPAAVKAVRAEGLDVPMMVSAVNDADLDLSRRVIETAAGQGIKYYRMGYFKYTAEKPVEKNIHEVKREMEKMARLNESVGIHGSYQNHAGAGYFSGSIWDLWYVLKDLPREWIGSQYDLRHAVYESPNNWKTGISLIADYVNTLAVKDSKWAIGDSGFPWAKLCPLGEGFADFPLLFKMLPPKKTPRPVSIHFEYPIGGAEHGSRELTVGREVILEAMKRDVEKFRDLAKNA